MTRPRQPTPGDIFILPPGVTHLNDPKWHRHALLAAHFFDSSASLVYASSSAELQADGAACHLVQPTDGNQLTHATYFYGSVLVSVPDHHLTNRRSDIASELQPLRAAVRRAMGHRSGPGYERPAGQPSLRGRIIEVTTEHEQIIGTRHFVVLTEHDYSMKRKHQIVMPLFSAADWEPDGAGLLSIDTTPAMRQVLGANAQTVLCAGLLAHSIWHKATVHSETRCSLDRPQLEAIEDEVCAALAI